MGRMLSEAQQKALAAYNWGPSNLEGHLDKYNGALNVSELPEETQNYIKRINELVAKGETLDNAQITVESGGRPDVVSKAGAVGLTQILPTTATNPGFSSNQELTELSAQLSELSKSEVIERLKNPEFNQRFGRAYREALFNKFSPEGSVIAAEVPIETAKVPTEIDEVSTVTTAALPYQKLREERERLAVLGQRPSLGSVFGSLEESIEDVTAEEPSVTVTEPSEVSLSSVFGSLEESTEGVTEPSEVSLSSVFGSLEGEDQEKVSNNFAHISTNRRVQFGAARERMVLGLLWDMGKGASRALLDGDKTYAEAMDEVHEEELENIYKDFPEFRGVSFFDEDAPMLAGRVGVAFIDPVSYMLPWGKVARLGYLGTMGLSGGYAAAFSAGMGHVERDEALTSPEMLGGSFVFGATLGAAGLGATRYYNKIKANRVGTEAEKLNTSNVIDESVEQTQETLETLNNTGGKPSVTVVNENAKDPVATILENNSINRDFWLDVPINSSTTELANASRRSFNGHTQPEVNRVDINNINAATQKIINTTGSKFVPDPKVATELSNDLQIIIRHSKQLKEVNAQLKKKPNKAKKAELKKFKLQLEESLAATKLRDLKNTVNRAMDGQDLAELTFDMAVKEGWLTHGVMQGLIREGTRPLFGAMGGFTASQFFADTEDGYGSTAAWTIGGAALMRWHKKIQTAPISSFDKETGEMIIHDQWRKWVSYSNLKFLTASSVSTKLDSLGGVGKVVGNLLFDRPGGGTRSIESNAYDALLSWNKNLGDILNESRVDEKVLKVSGEALNKFVRGASVADSMEEVLQKITVGYKGLDEKQVAEVKRIVPLLEKQRDDLALSIDRLGIPFERLDDYGMAQLYNLDAIRRNPEKFKEILANNLPKFKESSAIDKKRGAETQYNKMFPRNSGAEERRVQYDSETIIGSDYKFRPLMNHFEKERYIKDFETRKLLAEEGFINLNAKDVFQTYAKKTIEIREFAKVFGPNSERLQEAFRIVDDSFKKAGFSQTDDQYIKYKKYMRDSVNAYFGKYGDAITPFANAVNPVSQMMVALSNMTFLTRVGIPSLNDFVQPFKATSTKAAVKALGYRLSKSEASPSRRVGLKYNDDFEDELRAILVGSNDSFSTYTDLINKSQRGFFKLVQLKSITEQAGRFAFDTGAFRAFDVAKILAKNKPLGKPLQREIKEMGLQNQDLFYLAKFKNANEAFDDTIGKQILTRAGLKVMDRDRLVPKVGNRLLFTQHRDPTVRQLGQFASWAQAKTAQTNAMIKRIEDGDMKLLVRIMGANIIAGSAVNFLRAMSSPYFDADEDLEPLKFTQKTMEMGGDFNNWFVTRFGSAFKYNLKRGNSLAESVSPSWSWGAGILEAVGSAYNNIVEDGDIEGAAEDIISVLPLAGEFNKQAKRFDLPHLEDRRKDAKFYTSPTLYAKGGEVLNVPNVPEEPDKRIDRTTGLPYDDQARFLYNQQVEDPLRRLGFGVGSVAARAASKLTDTLGHLVPSRSISKVIPDRARAERAVESGRTTEAFHGTLSHDISAFKIMEGELGVHVGTPEQAGVRLRKKVEDERMADIYFERNQEAARIEKEIADFMIKESKPSKSDLKRLEKLNDEANELQKELPVEDFMFGVNILPVMVKANNPLRIGKDIGDWTDIHALTEELLKSDLVKRPARKGSMSFEKDPALVRKVKDFKSRVGILKHGNKALAWTNEKERVEKLKDFIKEFGYDSIIYKNMYEVDFKAGQAMKDSLIIFEPKDIRSRYAKFDPEEIESANLLKATGGKVLGRLREQKVLGGVAARMGSKLFKEVMTPVKAVDKFQEVLKKAGKTQDDLTPKIIYNDKGVEKAQPEGVFSTNEVIKPDPIKKEQWSLTQEGFKQKQNSVVAKAASDLEEGIIDEVEYDKIVREKLPVQRKEKLEAIPTDEDVEFGLDANKVRKGILNKNLFITDGTTVQTRLDIPAYERFSKWIVSIHDGTKKGKQGDVLGYGKTAVLNNVSFMAPAKAAVSIAKGTRKNKLGKPVGQKTTFARMEGEWQNTTTEEAADLARTILKGIKEGDETWTQVGFNPYRHSFFYDEKTMKPLLGAEQVVQIGKLVFAKGARKTDRMDEAFTVKRKDGSTFKFNEGGLFSTALNIIPTPIKAGIASLLQQGVWKEDFLNTSEQERLSEVVAERVNANSSAISYADIDPKLRGSEIGYGMQLPDFSDVNKTLKFTLGKANIVRDGNNVMVADEFDFPLSDKTKNLEGFLGKAKFLATKAAKAATEYGKENPSVSLYGLAHYIGEIIGPQEGEGPSVRFNIGSFEDLNISREQFERLPSLDDYEKKNEHRIRPRGIPAMQNNPNLNYNIRHGFFTGGLSEEVLSKLEASGNPQVAAAAKAERANRSQQGVLEKKYEGEITRTQETGMSSSDVERQNILNEEKSSEQPQTNVEFETDPLQRLGFTGTEDTTKTSVSPTEETQAPSVGWGAVDAILASPEKMAEAQRRAEERRANEAKLIEESNKAAASWVNSQYDPDRNKGGYTRYDYTKRGSGLHLARNFADGARIFDTYGELKENQPGYTHYQNALYNLASMGVTAETATNEQKFDAMDLAFRGAQWKNRRSKRGGVGSIVGALGSLASFYANPGVMSAISASRNIKSAQGDRRGQANLPSSLGYDSNTASSIGIQGQ